MRIIIATLVPRGGGKRSRIPLVYDVSAIGSGDLESPTILSTLNRIREIS
jgi:hypothetical protein